MQVVILCGGYGMRMRDMADSTPKPLSMVGGKPILLHIMKLYSSYGFREFILPLGYMGEKIKKFFMEYDWRSNDFVMEFQNDEKMIHLLSKPEKWKITFIDTGLDTMTGGRIKKIEPYIDGNTFLLTYGDGLCSVDINKLIEFHHEKNKIATLTGVKKKSQYGILKVKDGIAASFNEKTEIEGVINGGFFVLEKRIFYYLDGDNCVFEQEPLEKLSSEGQLAVFEHDGFWEAVDTYKDLKGLNDNWKTVKEVLKI